MAFHSKSVEKFVHAYLELIGDKKQYGIFSDSHFSTHLNNAYQEAYRIKFSDDNWRKPIVRTLENIGTVNPKRMVTNNKDVVPFLFDYVPSQSIVYTGDVQHNMDKELTKKNVIDLKQSYNGLTDYPQNSFDVCLDVRPELNEHLKLEAIEHWSPYLKSEGFMAVTVPRRSNQNKATLEAKRIIRAMAKNKLIASPNLLVYLPTEILVPGVKR